MATWLTVPQVARYLQLSEAKVYELARSGDLPASKVGSQWRFAQEEIDSWMMRGTARPRKGTGRR